MRITLFNSPATLLALITMALVSLGIIMVYSSSGARAGLEYNQMQQRMMERAIAQQQFVQPKAPEAFVSHHHTGYIQKQLMWTFIGLAAMVVVMQIPIAQIERFTPLIMGITVIFLSLVVFSPLGVTAKGARRWLNLGIITVQPAEFSKISLILFMAWFLAKKRDQIQEFFRGFVPTVGIWVLFAILIILERDLGTIILMGSVMVGMWLLAKMRMTHLATLGLLSLPVLVFLLFQHSYRIKRVLAFMNPEDYASTHAHQLIQSLIAVGSGGLFGKGLGLGLQKYHFLPEAHTDFVFATVGEEIGLVGALCVVVLFLCFALTGLRISYNAPDYFGGLVSAGITMMIAFAALINFAVVLGLVPTKGLALPFFSYGGSAMVASLMGVGLLLNIANYTARSEGASR
jgi:cell division protein FtsW